VNLQLIGYFFQASGGRVLKNHWYDCASREFPVNAGAVILAKTNHDSAWSVPLSAQGPVPVSTGQHHGNRHHKRKRFCRVGR